MALDFLNGLSSLLNLGGEAIQASNTLKGYQPTAAEGAQAQGLSNQSALIQALLDPNSTIFKNVFAANRQQVNSQTQQGLQNLMQAQRQAQIMGRGTFFNPERQDEAISQFLSKQVPQNEATARSNALNQIIQAANSYGSNASGYGGMVKNQQNAQDINRNALPTGLNQISNILGQFGKGGAMNNILSMFGGAGGAGAGFGTAGTTIEGMPWLAAAL